ncbi:MAG TPA: hypothetical protein VJ276_12870, partial [Thermoanaerobaculia bacterium]|nr:hypothetical protein [Thermoanaerobaculia bacterium]
MQSHFGHTQLLGNAGGFTVSVVSFRPCARLPEHAHDEPQLSMVFEGGMLEVGSAFGQVEAPSGAGYRPAGYRHTNDFSPAAETRGLIIDVHGEEWARLGPLFGAEARYAVSPRLPSLFRRIHEELTGSSPAQELALEAAILDFAACFARALEPLDLAAAVDASLEADPARRWDASSLALALGVTVEEVAAIGSLPRLLLRTRVRVAERLLLETREP